MSKWAKFWDKLSAGRSDNNIDYYYKHPLAPAPVNIQPRRDGKAKGYQVEQVREALGQYTGEDNDGWL